MSRCRYNDDACDCGLLYRELKTGLKYKDVYSMLMDNGKSKERWRYKRRRTVLGLWHQIKLSMWREHQELCFLMSEYVDRQARQTVEPAA